MNLGILLSFGSSFRDQNKTGQDVRFKNYYLNSYNKNFNKTYIFSYENEKSNLPEKCILVVNKWNLSRFIYCFLIPFVNYKQIKDIDIFRVMQLTGIIPAVIIKILYKKPFIFTYGYDYEEFSKLEGHRLRPLLLRMLKKIAFRFASLILVTNKEIESKLRAMGNNSKIVYLPNGVDTKKFKPGHTPHFGQKNINILFVGRLEKQKNLFNLINAVSLLKNYSINLLFIGQGKLKNKLISSAKYSGVKLEVIDSVSHDKIVKYYQDADIFVLPSYIEGHPKALIEAMACGLPSIVGKYNGIGFEDKKEVLFTGFEARDISRNISTLLNYKLLRRYLIINSQIKVKKEYDINMLIKKEIELIKSVEN